jgi:hypothetical protein
MLDPVAHDRQIALTHEGKMRRRGWTPLRSGYALTTAVQSRRILILIDAAVSP